MVEFLANNLIARAAFLALLFAVVMTVVLLGVRVTR